MDNELLARLRVAGGSAFARQMGGAASSIRNVKRASEQADTSMGGMAKTARRLGANTGYAIAAMRGLGTASVVGLGLGAAAGLKFNASMEQNQVAFRNFLGSTKAANAELGTLYNIAKATPFEFGDVVDATKRFMAFGFSARDSNKWLTTIADTASGLGLGQEGIQRMVTAIGQIQTKGKLSTEELMQLAENGVPAFRYAAQGLGISMGQLFTDLQSGSIRSDDALAALRMGMQKSFGGLSAKQAQTFSGRFSTLKDDLRQTAGTLSGPLFRALRDDVFPWTDKITNSINAWAKGGGMQRLGAQARGLFAGARGGVQTGIAGAQAGIGAGMDWLRNAKLWVDHARGIQLLITGLRAFAGAWRWTFLNVIWPITRRVWPGIVQIVQGAFRTFQGIINIFTGLLTLDVGRMWKGIRQVFSGQLKMLGGGMRAGTAALRQAASMAFGAIGDVASAVVHFIAQRFRDLLAFIGRVVGKVKGVGEFIFKHSPAGVAFGAGKKLVGLLPGKAAGGGVGHSGPYVVGERGPEIVNLRRGDYVTPNARSIGLPTMPRGPWFRLEVPVQVNGRELGRALAHIGASDLARA